MKRFGMIILAALFFAAAPAAAELFVRKNAKPAEPAPEPVQQQVEEIMPHDPALEPETMQGFASRYQENCLKQQHPFLAGESLKMLCSCSAGKLEQTMTVDEVKAMMQDTPEGQGQRNRMAIHVYGPCMEYPVRAMLLNNCSQNKQVLEQHKNAAQICNCMADDIAAYTGAHGKTELEKRLTANPNDPDPLGGFMASEAFQAMTQKSFLACVQKHPVTP